MKKLIASVTSFIIACAMLTAPTAAMGAESVEVPGQVGVDQCPAGFQYSIGISVNAITGVYTTICNAPPNDADLLLRSQDSDFQNRISQAQAQAESASRAWNQANPGLQKCIQWGPIIHANGVSTSSGGVCANPVSLPEGVTTPVLDAPQVDEVVPVITPNPNLSPTNSPFFVEVPGQVGIQGCPSGYQGANGLTVNATTGVQTTQCWTADAWSAYRLGGNVWETYQATGGAYDVEAELDRREKVLALIARAKTVADAAADSTPGIKRCSTWTGYGETGQVCGYTFIDPKDTLSADPKDTLGDLKSESASSDSTDIAPANAPTREATSLVSASSFRVPAVAKTTLTLKSLTPKTCKVSGLRVSALKKGSCTYSLTSKAKNGKKSTVKKSVVFVG